ncbi:hypothetical protein PInf_016538 [Phytophthora infestans]|nr:hypothetical protein PInf_016538 [Phytophthora infestans]
MDEVEEAGDGRDDGVTAVEAVVERETSIVRDTVETVETVEDAERTKGSGESVSDSESEEGVDEDRSTEALLTTFDVTTEPTDKSQRVSFSRLRHKPRLGAEPPLKSALKNRPSEDADIGVGKTVLATWTLEDGSEETVVGVVAQEVVEITIEREAATVPDHGEVVSDLIMVGEAPEAKYSRLFTDSELEAMEECDRGEEETVLAGVKVVAEKEEYDKELEERLGPLDEVERKR